MELTRSEVEGEQVSTIKLTISELEPEEVSTEELQMSKDLEDQCPPSTKHNEDEIPKVSNSVRIKQILNKIPGKESLKKAFTPSIIGAVCKHLYQLANPHLALQFQYKIVGFVVGVIPQIRKAFIGDNAPLRMIQGSATLLGNGALPAVVLIMGGNLIKGIRSSDIQTTVIVGIIVARYIALPLLGIGVVKGAIRLGMVHSDPLYRFILLLQFAIPPAMNISTMVQLFGAGENECSVIFLWAYALASISLTLWSTLFLWLVSGW